MKFYLSSVAVPDNQALQKLVGKDPHDTRVTLIGNAFDNYDAEKRNKYVGRTKKALEAIGYAPAEIDLRLENNLEEILAGTDLLWVSGGNSFYLRYLVKVTESVDVLKDYLSRGTYGGESAGAILVGQSLNGVENLDNPDEAPEVIFDGLGLLPFSVMPHWGTKKYEKELQACYEALTANSTEVIKVTDKQAVVVDGAVWHVIG